MTYQHLYKSKWILDDKYHQLDVAVTPRPPSKSYN